MYSCIFIDHPLCSFDVAEFCRAPVFQVINCSINHRRLKLTGDGQNLLLVTFARHVVNSELRVKDVQGQHGRDILQGGS